MFSLPIYPELTDAQIGRVVEVIKGFFAVRGSLRLRLDLPEIRKLGKAAQIES